MPLNPKSLTQEWPEELSRTVLLVEGDPAMLDVMVRLCHNQPFKVLVAHDPVTTRNLLASHSVDVILWDFEMPAHQCAPLLREVIRVSPETVHVIVADHIDLDSIVRLVGKEGAQRIIMKSWLEASLLLAIGDALRASDLLKARHRGDERAGAKSSVDSATEAIASDRAGIMKLDMQTTRVPRDT